MKSRDVTECSGVIFAGIRAKLSAWTSAKFTAQNRRLSDNWLLDSRTFFIKQLYSFFGFERVV